MEPKPFSIKAPEEVASAYGGNKQKIAQAIQMGALDPTSGLLAGMFIDRMRSAQAMEQAPQQSVAQQVFAPPAPPAPPAGLGAIGPQGGGMPAPPPSAPPAGLGAMPPVGMAAGGMTELPDSYGLESLPIPDNMYNEESFAGGGIVAFADAGDVRTKRRKVLMARATDPDATSDQRMAARMELNAMDGMGPGRTPGPGLADALAFTKEDLKNLTPQAEPSIYSPSAGEFKGGDLSVYAPDAPPRSADSIYSPSGTGSAKAPSMADLSRLLPRAPQVAGDSIYSPEGGGVRLPSRVPQNADAFTGTDGLTADYSREADYPRVAAGPNKGKTLAELTAAARAANEASGQVPFKGLGRALLPFPERQALEAKERAEAQARPVTPPSSSKSDLGRVNMDGYDPNRSSPEAQLNAILGKSAPAPGLPSLLASQEVPSPAPRAAGTATGRRGAPRATRTPAGATAPAAGTTPEMSDEDIAEKRMQDFLAAAKLPAPKGTTAEEKAARKNEDLWSALAQIGFGMAAGESPNFLTNVGKATAAAVPGMQESLKERRADTKEELKQQYAYELAQAGVKGDAYKLKLGQFDKLEDNRYRKETLAEQIRSNRRREDLQVQQIAATSAAADKDTGGERIIKMMAAGMPGGATPQNVAKAAEIYVKGYTGVIGGSEIGNKATDNIKDRLKSDITLSSRLRALATQDKKNAKAGKPTTLYDTEYNRLVQEETNRLRNMSLSAVDGKAKPGWSLLPEPQS